MLNAFLIPILIQQYPDFFESNPEALPLALAATLVLLLPVAWHHFRNLLGLIHERFGGKHPSMAWIAVIVIGALVGGLASGGGYWLYMKHTAHATRTAENRLRSQRGPEPDNAKGAATPRPEAMGSQRANKHTGRQPPLRGGMGGPSLDVTFDPSPGREAFNFLNRGSTNLYVWGTKLDDGPQSIDAPRVVTPGGSYHIWAQQVAAEMRQKLGARGEERVSLEIYASLEDERQFVLTYQLWVRISNGHLTIETQNMGFKNEQFKR